MTINGLLDTLFRRHNKELLVFATQRAGNAGEDLVQEAYMRLMQHPDPASIENIRAFLFRTTSNLSIDLHRRQMLEARVFPELPPDGDIAIEAAQVAIPTARPEQQVSHQQQLERLRAILDELPEITRHTFMLNRIEGLSHAEIAQRLNISVRSSERHLSQALRHLLSQSEFDQ